MTVIAYGKRRYVPEACPVCGDTPPKYDGTFQGLLRTYFSWHAVLRKHPVFRVPFWFGECGNCMMREEIMRKDSFLSRIAR